MPFGKYKGLLVEDVPTDYLEWMLETCRLRYSLREAVQCELTARLSRAQGDRHRGTEPPPPVNWQAVLTEWYRGLALDYHPDRGGSVEAMQAINEAHKRLKRLVGIG
jgi:hypothetical protein